MLDATQEFSDQTLSTLRATTRAEVEDVMARARSAFTAGRNEEATALFAFLADRGKAGPLPHFWLAELRLRAKDPEGALKAIEQIAARNPDNARINHITARALLLQGLPDEAAAVLKKLVALKPDDENFLRLLFNALERSSDPRTELGQPERYLGGLSEDDKLKFLLRAAIAREDFDEFVRLLESAPASISTLSPDLLKRVCSVLLTKEQNGVIGKMYELAGGGASAPLPVVSARLKGHIRENDWQASGLLLEETAGRADVAGDADIRARRLTVLCKTMKYVEAQELLASWGDLLEAPQPVRDMAGKLYAVLGDWSSLLDLFCRQVSHGLTIGSDVARTMIVRATRETRRYSDTLAVLDSLPASAVTLSLAELRDTLKGEILELQTLGAMAADIAPRPPDNPLRRRRIELVRHAVNGPEFPQPGPRIHTGRQSGVSAGKLDVYFCTDLKYLLGASVGLFSLLRSNENLGRSLSLSVFVSHPALDLARGALGRIAARFGIPIEVVAIESILERDIELRKTYGFFAPGRQLSHAAYWRIFAAKWLHERRRSHRALYLDSDICVGPGLGNLLDFDLQGHALAACPDNETDFARKAAETLGIDPDAYFNSGVLLFDLRHPAIGNALDVAIELAFNQQHMLTFHDQCALNFAFDKLNIPLPHRFNSFVRPDDLREQNAPGQVIRHYLDDPKPWDPMYASPASLCWFEEFGQMSDVIGAQLSKQLFSIQFDRMLTH